MLLIDLIWCSSLDTPLGTEFLTFTTADTGICYHIPLFPDYSISKAVCLTKYRIHAQIKIFYLTLINTEYNTYTSGITRIDICQIRLLLKDGITPFLLFFLAHRICLSRQSYHLFIFCIAKDLNPSIFQKFLTEILPPCRIKIQGIRFIMDRTDIPYLRRTIFIHCCKCKDSYQFHLL